MFSCGTDCSHDLSYAFLDLEGAIASAFERKREMRAEKDEQRMELYLLVSFLVTAMPCLKPSLLALAIASAASGRTLADGTPTADMYFGLLFRAESIMYTFAGLLLDLPCTNSILYCAAEGLSGTS